MTVENPIPHAPDAKLRTPSNLRLRMIASVVMIAVASAALVWGGFAFWLLAVIVSLFMMAEWADLQRSRRAPSGWRNMRSAYRWRRWRRRGC